MLSVAPTDYVCDRLSVPAYGAGLAIILPSGKIVIIRHLTPDDSEPLTEFIRRLSDQSVERRFMRSKAAVLAEVDRDGARSLIHFDRAHQTALVATVVERNRERFIAVGRLARSPRDPSLGELGITVRDDFQGQGLGTFLCQMLGEVARERGITRMVGYTQVNNKPIFRMLNKLGLKHDVHYEHSEAYFVIEIE